MSFYKRSFHSFLGQTNIKTMAFKDEPPRPGHDEINGSIPSVTTDPGGIGFADEANGLMLCTEYLGFESYDMRMSDNEMENKMACQVEAETERVETKRRKMKREFPPPLSSLNGRGKRSFYLKPVRKDGRLELTQVMIDRPEIFHASREDGRLRLHLVDSVNNPMRAYCDSQETVDLEEESKGLDQPIAFFTNGSESKNISGSDLESGREIKEDNNDDASHQVVDLSMINDDSAVKSWRCHEVSLNSDDEDVHDAREWRYKSCYKFVASMNHDGIDHHHHHHHHIHPYHQHNSNNNMHLWSRTYVKTR
ncbi:Protein FANTASTIC FOUR 3 [Cardamine amara subsp. amara]|uniref:Protein FANTASTIC FOUR 3 n=1 Tax=Cardamine amara subsp. amara TaxID=228776 RepID=A0ABD0ZH40_CARAN